MRKTFWAVFWACLSGVVLLISSCNAVGSTVPDSTPTPQTTADLFPGLPRLNGEATVEMVVNGSTVTMEIRGQEAPITAGNFIDLVQQGFYDGLTFHRVVREPQPFVVQGGDPQSRDPNFPAQRLGTGGYKDPKTGLERSIPLEILPEGADTPIYSKTLEQAGVKRPPVLNHRRGAVAMARSQYPNSASSQFYITLADWDFLDGNYAVFGYVTEGMEVVDKIEQKDKIQSMKVTSGLDNLVLPQS
jgi:peptidyl-prolyl cis-trans isomerase B (cyclophilin B)